MQRWEYCEVTGYPVVFYERSGLRRVSHSGMEQAVAELGLEGWEAYAVVGEDGTVRSYCLKRPIGG